jgi:hypothetical protein
MSRKLGDNPLLRNTYEMYIMCRSTQLVIFRKPTGKKDGSEKIVTVVWPTGITTWPRMGGAEDQSYLTSRLFAAALRGEQQGMARMMAKP